MKYFRSRDERGNHRNRPLFSEASAAAGHRRHPFHRRRVSSSTAVIEKLSFADPIIPPSAPGHIRHGDDQRYKCVGVSTDRPQGTTWLSSSAILTRQSTSLLPPPPVPAIERLITFLRVRDIFPSPRTGFPDFTDTANNGRTIWKRETGVNHIGPGLIIRIRRPSPRPTISLKRTLNRNINSFARNGCNFLIRSGQAYNVYVYSWSYLQYRKER